LELVEVDMTTLFSLSFSALFIAFIVAAIAGHVLLIEALVRPFFARAALPSRPAPAASSLRARPA
jgi:hypothetical protein